jgi:hypothetical protein
VVVAVVIACCSYAVSATSLGGQAGYSWWQAAAVPVVADGPAAGAEQALQLASTNDWTVVSIKDDWATVF